MFSKIAIAGAIATAAADVWAPVAQNMTIWPANDHTNAGAEFMYASGAGMISNGTGSCDVSIATAGVAFVHFYDAHVSTYQGANTWTIYAMNTWEDTGSFTFMYQSTATPDAGDVTVSCQNDAALADGSAVLSSFPQAIDAHSARGSFTTMNKSWPAEISLSFSVGEGPADIMMDDINLSATEVAADSWTISGMDSAVNYDDVWFTMQYNSNNITVPAYGITLV